MSLRKIFYGLPPSLRYLARRVYYLPHDLLHTLKKDKQLAPPKGLIYTGAGDFLAEGNKQKNLILEHTGITPTAQLLDIGSGIGRTALAFTTYLSSEGGYYGFDVVERGVKWCQQHISTNYPQFHFTYVPLKNDLYRSTGASASEFRFPYADNRFDTTFAFSVFTHLLPDTLENYLAEVARTLRPGAKGLFTFFVYDEKNKATISKREDFSFPYDYGHYKLMDKQVKAANVAYDWNYLQAAFARNELHILGLEEGFWRGKPKSACKDFQDIVLFEKK